MTGEGVQVTDLGDLQLKFGGRLVEQLGAQMYPSATATVAELISNSWDADARHVWVTMPLGGWERAEIIVVDDGMGMTRDEARDAYLIVGYNRREDRGQRTPGGRLVHGRKGIGKLAAFGTASILELTTKQQGSSPVSFRLDYENIRKRDPDQPYTVEPSEDDAPLTNPLTTEPLEHGTRIRLTKLHLKRRLSQQQFIRSMSRRFSLSDHEMTVYINGEALPRFELDLDIRFPPDEVPPGVRVEGSWAVEDLSNGKEVKWWIGFTEKPLRGEAEQGVSVLVRGKLAQRPFKFERSTGTTGQLGQEYLVGEVIADWIDEDTADESEPDYIQSNRDQLQLEDRDLGTFLEWGRRRLVWALNARNGIRQERNRERLQEIEGLRSLADPFPAKEKAGLMRVAEAVSNLPEVNDSQLVKIMEAVVQTREGETAKSLADEIALEGHEPERLWELLSQLEEVDGRTARSFVEARIDALAQIASEQFDANVDLALRRLLSLNPGLADPAWEASEAQEQSAKRLPGVFLIAQPNREQPSAVVAIISQPNQVNPRWLADLEGLAAGAPTFLVRDATVSANIPGVSAILWADWIERSRRLHQGWLEVLERRTRREQ